MRRLQSKPNGSQHFSCACACRIRLSAACAELNHRQDHTLCAARWWIDRLDETMDGAWLRYMTVIRIVDIFVLEGYEALLRAALGLLTMLLPSLMQVGALCYWPLSAPPMQPVESALLS
jgi:hypothetical protein